MMVPCRDLIIYLLGSLIALNFSIAEEVTPAPKTVKTISEAAEASEDDKVKFKSSFPYSYGYGAPTYGYSPYQPVIYGGNQQGLYGQPSSLSYSYPPQYGAPVSQPNTYYSGQPYNYLNSLGYPYQSSSVYTYTQQPLYNHGIPSQGNTIYIPQGYPISGNAADVTKVVIPSNVHPTNHSGGDEPKRTPPATVHTSQPSTIYIPSQTGVHSGGLLPNYPYNDIYNNPYDPFANVPTEIIDIDLTNGATYPHGGGMNGYVNGNYEIPVKVTSHTVHSGGSPIIRTDSSVVTSKPFHATITRVFDPSKSDNPTVSVDVKSDEDVVTHSGGLADQSGEDKEDEDEEPSDINSWL